MIGKSKLQARQEFLLAKMKEKPETKRQRDRRLREMKAFARMGAYLARQAKWMKAEREASRFSIPSTWQGITEMHRYELSVGELFDDPDVRKLKAIKTDKHVFGGQLNGPKRKNLAGKLVVLPGREQYSVEKHLQADGGSGRMLERPKIAA